ncbi:MAG TPA: hypothetical protein VFD58_21205 [Blastocatellia bacterium]|nr:hypothetical protein [Blastocatellia bacterium]
MSKYYVQSKGEIILTQAEFKAQGGQGAVYVKGGTAYKIYFDLRQMIPTAKIQELSALTVSNIIRPLDVLLDGGNRVVGYSMRHVENAYTLCQLFPRSFRQRANLTPDVALELVRKLQAGVSHVHSKNMLIVDLNEMNFLVADDFGEVFFLDVDSWQTRSFPATALMESVRDRHATKFDERSDWFSFAVVSFQMFVGIHPFKGTYPPFQKLKDKTQLLDARMRANISVLHPGVAVPAACLPFDVIPEVWRDWYKAVFEDGQRVPPPEEVTAVIIPAALQIQKHSGSDHFEITEFHEFDSAVVAHDGNVTITEQSVYISGRKYADLPRGEAVFATTPRQRHVILARLEGGRVFFRDLTGGQDLKADVTGQALLASGGRIYIKSGSNLLEADFVELSGNTLVGTKAVGSVLPNAAQVFDGVVIQNLLGAYYASFLPSSGVCHQARLGELDGYQIVEAVAARNVLMVVAAKGGTFDKFIYRFTDDFDAYDLRVISDVTLTGINFVVLDSGVCLHLTDRDELELFSRRKGSADMKVISDPAIRGDVRLFHSGAQALVARGNKLCRITMRNR